MFKNVKRFLLNMLAGANVAVALLMVLVGWSGHLHPAEHPMLSCVGLPFPLFILLNLAFLVVWVLFSPKRIFIPLLAFAISFLHVRTYIPINFKGGDVPEGAFLRVPPQPVSVLLRPGYGRLCRAQLEAVAGFLLFRRFRHVHDVPYEIAVDVALVEHIYFKVGGVFVIGHGDGLSACFLLQLAERIAIKS